MLDGILHRMLAALALPLFWLAAAAHGAPTLDYDGSVVPVTANPASPNLAGWRATPLSGGSFDLTGLASDGNQLNFTAWPYPHSLFTPNGVFSDFSGAGSAFETHIQVSSGRLYFIIEDGVRQYQIVVSPSSVLFLKISPAQVITVNQDFTVSTKLRIELAGGNAKIFINDVLKANESAGSGAVRTTNYLQIIALDGGNLPTAAIDSIRIEPLDPVIPLPPARQQAVTSPYLGYTTQTGTLNIEVGPTRQILRGTRTPLGTQFNDGSIVINGMIKSTNGGETWRSATFPQLQLCTIERSDGKTIMLEYNPAPISGEPGYYQLKRYESNNQGQSVSGPFTNGKLFLPTDQFISSVPQWLHSNIIERANGDLLVLLQSQSNVGSSNQPWKVSLVKSTDGGVNWAFVAPVLNKDNISDPNGLLTRENWPLYYAVEPSLIEVDGRIVAVARAANDEAPGLSTSLIGPPSDEYHDLFNVVTGAGIHSSLMNLPGNKFYQPGARNAPLVIAYSDDGGATWHDQQPMEVARGCFPRFALSSDAILALTYGGLSGVPRWGNCITFSLDGGLTWSPEINVGPYLTTGYTNVYSTGPGKFVVFFDCTPPQPWTDQLAWWIGAVDVTVTHFSGTNVGRHFTQGAPNTAGADVETLARALAGK